MNIILLGPQGSGKGTQAVLLSSKFGLLHLEMGRILRSIASSDNKHAEDIRKALNNGALVPDELTRLIAWDFITKHQPKTNGFLFEGYPRSLMQYEHLKDMLEKYGRKLDLVINIEITEEETIKRLSTRRTCIACGEVFNTVSNPSDHANTCDKCGGKLVLRDDDKSDAIKRRLKIYREQTREVFEHALGEGIGHEIDGSVEIESVLSNILLIIENEKLEH